MEFQPAIPPGTPAPPEAFYTGLDLAARAPAQRPYVIANFVSSADGKATADGRSAPLGSPGDRAAFHLLRTQVDAVLAGNRTMFIENYGPLAKEPRLSDIRVGEGRAPQPLGVAISRSGTIPFDIPLFADGDSRVAVYGPPALEVPETAAQVIVHELGSGETALSEVLSSLRAEHGVAPCSARVARACSARCSSRPRRRAVPHLRTQVGRRRRGVDHHRRSRWMSSGTCTWSALSSRTARCFSAMPVTVADGEAAPRAATLRCVGIVVHPSRDIDGPLDRLRDWAEAHGVTVVQVPVPARTGASPSPATPATAISSSPSAATGRCSRPSVPRSPCAGRSSVSPAAASACSPRSPALTVPEALDRFYRGDWTPRALPALTVTRPDGPDLTAFNDACVVRNGIGQVRVTSMVDGVLFTRLAGDGCIVSTPLGSTAYALAAGGPLMAPGTDAYLLMPLASHGGWRQPLVVPAAAELALEISAGIGGARLEIDGQVLGTDPTCCASPSARTSPRSSASRGRSRSSPRCAGAASSPTAPGSSPTPRATRVARDRPPARTAAAGVDDGNVIHVGGGQVPGLPSPEPRPNVDGGTATPTVRLALTAPANAHRGALLDPRRKTGATVSQPCLAHPSDGITPKSAQTTDQGLERADDDPTTGNPAICTRAEPNQSPTANCVTGGYQGG